MEMVYMKRIKKERKKTCVRLERKILLITKEKKPEFQRVIHDVGKIQL